MKKCIIKPINFDKIQVVTQGRDENAAYLKAI